MNSKFDSKMDISVYQFHFLIASKLVSLIREFEVQLGVKRAHEIVSTWAERNCISDVRGAVTSLENSVESFEDVKMLLRQWVQELNDNNIESVEITKETNSESVCMVTECIHAKVFNDLGAPDLGYLLYCKHDFAASHAIHPSIDSHWNCTTYDDASCSNTMETQNAKYC